MKTNRIVKYGFVLGAAVILLAAGIWLYLRAEPTTLEYVPAETSVPSTEAYWPTEEWQVSTPEEQGIDSIKLAETLQTLHKRNYAIDSLLIIRNSHVILDAYFYPYDGSFPHDLASVTKSFTTTLLAIAASQRREVALAALAEVGVKLTEQGEERGS